MSGYAWPHLQFGNLNVRVWNVYGPRSEVTLLLRRLSAGDKSALNQLMPLIYTELQQLASRYMRREHHGHTLQTTALVHEAYLQLVGQENAQWEKRSHFFGVSSAIDAADPGGACQDAFCLAAN